LEAILETILVVDDEASVLAVVEEMLKGYRILTAPNAEEAMRVSTSYVGRQLRLQRPR
jgi:CheY-like chemotaxis protein